MTLEEYDEDQQRIINDVKIKNAKLASTKAKIAIEHISIEQCEPCTQRNVGHSLDIESVESNEQIRSMIDEANDAAKFASDATSLNRELLQKINDLMEKLSSLIEKSITIQDQKAADDKLESTKQETEDASITKWAKYGNTVGAFLITLISTVAITLQF